MGIADKLPIELYLEKPEQRPDPKALQRQRLNQFLCLVCGRANGKKGNPILCDECDKEYSYCAGCDTVKPIFGPDGEANFSLDRTRRNQRRRYCKPCESERRPCRKRSEEERAAGKRAMHQGSLNARKVLMGKARARYQAVLDWFEEHPGATTLDYARAQGKRLKSVGRLVGRAFEWKRQQEG